MCILGSREQYCINPVLKTVPNKTEACNDMVKHNLCKFKPRAKELSSSGRLSTLGIQGSWDIEDLVKAGKKLGACPFFATKELKNKADIIFCPYNYLVSESIRTSLDLNLKGAILIFDEAHNIEDCCRESASFVLIKSMYQEAEKNVQELVNQNTLPCGGNNLNVASDHTDEVGAYDDVGFSRSDANSLLETIKQVSLFACCEHTLFSNYVN